MPKLLFSIAAAAAFAVHPLAAQAPDSGTVRSSLRPAVSALVLPGSTADEGVRALQVLGRSGTAGYLLRSPSTMTAPLSRNGGIHWDILAPQIDLALNSAIPFSLNEGTLWAGRGWTTGVSAGVRAQVGLLALTFAPQLIHAQNTEFDFVTARTPERSRLLPPWRTGDHSADLPLRFGTDSWTLFDLGESAIALAAGPVTMGITTESQWWGPGVRNAIVLSDNAGGFPHFFLRTSDPITTAAGEVEAKWIVGTLMESPFFDGNPYDGYRAFSGLGITWRPVLEPGLTVGLARTVMVPQSGPGGAASHALDVLTRWDQVGTGSMDEPSEQLFSFFWRWLLLEAGTEFYGEWARVELPRSLRDFLTSPHHSQGYTIGLQWLTPRGPGHLRVQGELTYLESSGKIGDRPTRNFYMSPHVPQGYTHRGQALGAAIGPGASSQWLAMDFVADDWQVGGYGTRIRWDDDSFYTRPVRDRHLAHDVSMVFGVRSSVRSPWGVVTGSIAHETRMNYLYQNEAYWWEEEQGVDIGNLVVRLSVTLMGGW